MGLLDITVDNFDITVGGNAKKIDVVAYTSFAGADRLWGDQRQKLFNNADHVRKIITNRIVKAIKLLVPYEPTGLQVRKVVEEIMGKQITCRKQKFTGREHKNTVAYHFGERGEERGFGATYFETYKDTDAEIYFNRIEIIY